MKQRIWYKKRTTRGSGRAVKTSPKINGRNLDREIRKNQIAYAIDIFRLVLVGVLSIVWIRLGGVMSHLLLPIGAFLAVIILMFNSIKFSRNLGFVLSFSLVIFSWMFPIGVII